LVTVLTPSIGPDRVGKRRPTGWNRHPTDGRFPAHQDDGRKRRRSRERCGTNVQRRRALPGGSKAAALAAVLFIVAVVLISRTRACGGRFRPATGNGSTRGPLLRLPCVVYEDMEQDNQSCAGHDVAAGQSSGTCFRSGGHIFTGSQQSRSRILVDPVN